MNLFVSLVRIKLFPQSEVADITIYNRKDQKQFQGQLSPGGEAWFCSQWVGWSLSPALYWSVQSGILKSPPTNMIITVSME